MRFGDRSDTELIQLAQAGWAPAFAVLVHRYAPVVRATRPRAEPAVPFLTHVFLLAMRDLRGRDPRAPVAPWLLGLAGAGTTSTKSPVPLAPEELDAIWTRLHTYWPDGHRHARNLPWRRTAAVVGLAALAGLVPAVVLGADGSDTEEEVVELRAVPLPDERTVEVVEEPEDDEPDFSFPTTPEEQEAPPSESTQPPPDETETTEPDPAVEPEDPTAGEDDDLEGEESAPDDEADDEDSGGLLDGVLGPGDGEDDQQDDEHDQPDGDEGAVEEHPEEETAADDAASDESEDA